MSGGPKYQPARSQIRLGVFLTFCITLVLCGGAYAKGVAQDSFQGKRLGLSLSAGIASYREDLLVPLGFNGPAVFLGGIYEQQSGKNLVHIRLRLGLGVLENRFSHRAWALMPDIRMSWVREIMAHHKYGEFHGGVSLPLQMNNLFFESWDDAHLYWLTAHSIAGAFQWDKEVTTKNHASVRIEVPFLSWVSRPPDYRHTKQDPLNHVTYHISEPNKSLHFEMIDDYRNVFMQLLLKRKRGGSLLSVGLEFQYFYCRKPETITALNTLLVFSYQWGVGQ